MVLSNYRRFFRWAYSSRNIAKNHEETYSRKYILKHNIRDDAEGCLIMFYWSLLAILIWLYSLYIRFGSFEVLFMRKFLGQKIEVNVLPGIVIFICIAISAGMAWG
jgi:hypothetical protein